MTEKRENPGTTLKEIKRKSAQKSATDGADAPVSDFTPQKSMETNEQYNQRIEIRRKEGILAEIKAKEEEQAEENAQAAIEGREANELYPELPALREAAQIPPVRWKTLKPDSSEGEIIGNLHPIPDFLPPPEDIS